MALVNPLPQPAVSEAFSTGLPAFLSGPDFVSDRLDDQKHVGAAPGIPSLEDISSPDGILRIQAPHQVFVLGLQDAAQNKGTGAAIEGGWRFFAGHAKFKTVMGRVILRLPSREWRLTAVYYGEPVAERDRVWDVLQAAHGLAVLPEVDNGTFELRMLSIPGLNLEAFWLVAQSALWSDLAVPFPARPNQPIRELNDSVVYPMESFLRKIAPLAERRFSAPELSGS